jgi:hypothetical protein
MAVGRCGQHGADRNRARGAQAVFHDHGLAQLGLDFFSDGAGDDVRGAAGRRP